MSPDTLRRQLVMHLDALRVAGVQFIPKPPPGAPVPVRDAVKQGVPVPPPPAVAAPADLFAAPDAVPDGPFARAALTLEGWHPGDDGAAGLSATLAAGRRRDAAAGRALTGPHRSDLAVVHIAKDQPAALTSTGEQKALLLGMLLAHAELVAERSGRAPVLLLDEVAAHLDPLRRAALFDRLAGRGQVWMTGTEPALFDAIGSAATRLHIGD